MLKPNYRTITCLSMNVVRHRRPSYPTLFFTVTVHALPYTRRSVTISNIIDPPPPVDHRQSPNPGGIILPI